MNSVFFTFATILILALSALFAAPYFINWNEYRDVFEAQATNLVGRKVTVAGNVNMRLLPVPYVSFGDVTIEGERGTSNEPFLKTNAFTMWLSVPPLLRGIIEAREMEIDGAKLNLKFDSEGKSNWSGLGNASANLPWIPQHIELKSVRIRNASIQVSAGEQTAPLILTHVNGDLSARTLKGPFKFTGHWLSDKVRRDIRLSTGQLEANGEVRFKSVIRVLSTGSVYNLDGQLDTLNDKPHFAGVLTANVPPLLKQKPQDGKTPAAPGSIEFKSALDVTLKRAVLNKMIISVEQQSRPQLIKGEAIVDWNRGLNVNGRLTAKLLDLDQLFGLQTTGSGPRDVLKVLGDMIKQVGPLVTRAAIQTEIEQATLGGDLVQAIDMHITKQGDAFQLGSLKIELPGSNTLVMSGRVEPHAGGIDFTGPVALSGQNLGRLMHWLRVGVETAPGTGVGGYTLNGRAIWAPGKIEVTDLRGEFGGAVIAGGFNCNFGENPSITVNLDTDRINLAEILGETASVKSLRAMLSAEDPADLDPEKKTQQSTSAKTLFGLPKDLNAQINLRIGHVILTGFEGRDVLVDASFAKEKLTVNAFNIISDDGLNIRADGAMEQRQSVAVGSLRMSLKAQTPSALKTLGIAIGLDEKILNQQQRLKAITPLRLAVTLNSGQGRGKGATIRLDGSAAGNDVSIRAELAQGLANPGKSDLALFGTIRSRDSRDLVMLLAGVPKKSSAPSAVTGNKPNQGIMSIRASGIPGQGMQTNLVLKSEGLNGTFDGAIRLSEKETTLNGALRINAKSSSRFLETIGFKYLPPHKDEPVSLTGTVQKTASTYAFADISGKWGSANLNGKGSIDFAPTPAAIDLAVGISQASLQRLLGFTVEWKQRNIVKDIASIIEAEDQPPWPNQAFDKNALSRFKGQVRLGVGALEIAPGIVARDAAIIANLEDGALQITQTKGALYGGTMTAKALLKSEGGAMMLTGAAELKNAKLENLAAIYAGQPLAKGQMNLSITFKGQGLSPRGLVSVLTGKGELALGKGEIMHLSPKVLPQIVGPGAGKKFEASISTLLKEGLQSESFPFAPQSIPLEIAHGTIRTATVSATAGQTRAEIKSTLDLASLQLSSEWSLAADLKKAKDKSPPISLVFKGSLSTFGKIKPVIETKSLERYMTVVKMERDVEKLERLQRQDRQQEEQEAAEQRSTGAISKPPVAIRPTQINTVPLPQAANSPDAVISKPLNADLLPSRNPEPTADAAQPAPLQELPVPVSGSITTDIPLQQLPAQGELPQEQTVDTGEQFTTDIPDLAIELPQPAPPAPKIKPQPRKNFEDPLNPFAN